MRAAPKCGEAVVVSGILERVDMKWLRREVAPFAAILVGKRTLWDSRWDSDGWEYPETRYVDHFFSPVAAYLVAPDLRRILRASPGDVSRVAP